MRANKIMHGKISEMTNENKSKIFIGLPKRFDATRYHSLVIEPKSLPSCFKIISQTIDDRKDVIMGIEHKDYPIYGVAFHPEKGIVLDPKKQNSIKQRDNLETGLGGLVSMKLSAYLVDLSKKSTNMWVGPPPDYLRTDKFRLNLN